MQSLRSVITQATRGGRWVSSRRNFSSSSVPKETNGALGDRVMDSRIRWKLYCAVFRVCGGFALGYLLLNDSVVEMLEKIKKRTEEYKREVETLQSSSTAADT